jgi:4-amino-4-deoxychorismate lyase
MYCFFDNIFLEEKTLNLSVNRAFEYGDGFFETIIVRNNQILYFSDHFLRIQNASQVLSLQLPDNFTEDFVRKTIQKLISNYHFDSETETTPSSSLESSGASNYEATFRIKITFWRKNGGFYTPTFPENECNTHILIRVVSHQIKNSNSNNAHSVITENLITKIAFSDKIKLSYSSFSPYKTLNSLPYILAGIEKTERNLEDLILLDTQKNISECIAANIFWIKNDKIFTPNLQTGCVGGIMRKQVINTANKLSIDLEEGFFQKKHLLDAHCIFTTNVTGIRWIQNIENQEFSKYKILEILAAAI